MPKYSVLLSVLLLNFAIMVEGHCEVLQELKAELKKVKDYDNRKEGYIDSLKHTLRKVPLNHLDARFILCRRIAEAYQTYKYDSAHVYAQNMMDIAVFTKDAQKLYTSKIKLSFILISAGLFKEADDHLSVIKPDYIANEGRREYYSVMARFYTDLAENNNDKIYTKVYTQRASAFLDSNLAISADPFTVAFKDFKNGHLLVAERKLLDLLNSAADEHSRAIIMSVLGRIYLDLGDDDNALIYLARAAISDIKTSTKETLAIYLLANMLYKQGEIDHAYIFLQSAAANADFYGALQRKNQINSILHLIEAEKLKFMEKEKSNVLVFSFTISLLAIAILFGSSKLIQQLKKVKNQERVIKDTLIELNAINKKLFENEKIKEAYIGQFFDLISGYIEELDRVKRMVESKTKTKKYDDLLIIADTIKISKEREKLLNIFDQVFLNIFPSFVHYFNKLFELDNQKWPKGDEILTTELRIFALMRLGINDVKNIAKILEYSERTIYLYKMRIKAKSIYNSEEFDKRLMAISALESAIEIHEYQVAL